MKFRKFFAIALCALIFTACSDDDKPDSPDKPDTTGEQTLYVINQGDYYSNIAGSLTKIDLTTGESTQNAFKDVNKRVLGDTPQCGIIYGSKMYIGVYGLNVIEVVDKNTLKSIKTIVPTAVTGTQPRSMVGKDGKVYVSMFDGYAARIDTLSLSIDKSIKVGPNPEQIAIAGNYLYVTNSDGMNFDGGRVNGMTVSKINLSTFTEDKKIPVGLNPTKIVAHGTELFVICMGDYTSGNVATLKRISADDSVESLFGATCMAIDGDRLYVEDAPWVDGVQPHTDYYVYNVVTKEKAKLNLEGIISLGGMSVNPQSGNLFVSSYASPTGWADPYIVNEYTPEGKLVKTYQAGICASAFVFNTGK